MSKTDKEKERYRTGDLLKSKAISKYQTDFARAVLTRPDYTIGEAEAALESFFGKGGTE